MTAKITDRPLMKAGRKPKAPPAGARELVLALAADGFTQLGIALRLGTSADTLRRWLEEHPDLAEAFEQGRENERWALHNMLYRQAMEHGNPTAAMFLLKARHGYKEGDQSGTGSRVNVTIALPGAMTLQQFTTLGAPGNAVTIEGKDTYQ